MGTTWHEFALPCAAVLLSSKCLHGTLQKKLEQLLGKSTIRNKREQGEKMAVLQQENRTWIKNNTNCLRNTFTLLCLD